MTVERSNRNIFSVLLTTHCNSVERFFCLRNFISPLAKESEILCRKTRSAKMAFNKYFFVSCLVLTFGAQLVCSMRPDYSLESPLVSTSPATNSIDTVEDMYGSEEAYEYGDGDDSEHLASPDIDKYYEMQRKMYNNNPEGNDVTTQVTTPKSVIPTPEPTCASNSCLKRQDMEAANTESIRKHILMKLGLNEAKINHTNYPKYSDELVEKFCRMSKMKMEHCFPRKFENPVEYPSDGPVEFEEVEEDRTVKEDEENVQFLSYENLIYAFPSSVVRPRHKTHLVFQFTESQKTNNLIARATLNLYINSRSYLKSLDVTSLKNIQLIDIEVAKVFKSSPHKRTFNTFRNVSVPDARDGKYFQFNITELVAEWFTSHDDSHTMLIKIVDSKSGENLPHRALALDTENLETRPFIEIIPRDQRKKRTKRSSLFCSKGSNENRCCRHELTVDFDKFGWDWIIAPKKYGANYCSGECKIAFMQQYPHTHVMQLSTAASPCCSPRKMTEMQLLYFDSQLNIVLGTIPNMVVEECFCS